MKDWSFMQWAIAVVCVCAVVAIVMIALPAMGIAIPGWVMSIVWVLVVVAVVVAALGLVAKIWNSWGGPPKV